RDQPKQAGAPAQPLSLPAPLSGLIVPGALTRAFRTGTTEARADEGVGGVSTDAVAYALAGMLLSALTTEWIGVHAVFGAFLFGAVIPHDSRLAHTLIDKLKDLVTILLLPAFFAFAGMRTRVDLVAGPSE